VARVAADGLQTTVGEHGAKVSGGQRRRIAAARLLLSPARFLIADEPAAHLDCHAPRRSWRARREARTGRGRVVIAHEPHGLDSFDEVLTAPPGPGWSKRWTSTTQPGAVGASSGRKAREARPAVEPLEQAAWSCLR
jgi:ABC-type transport system involved in cytochrome bd biosynthesis fused ATPase/permease subunit